MVAKPIAVALAVFIWTFALGASGQGYPSRPIIFVWPSTPGNAAGESYRTLAEEVIPLTVLHNRKTDPLPRSRRARPPQ